MTGVGLDAATNCNGTGENLDSKMENGLFFGFYEQS